jgi:hypothetical protein
MKNILILGSGRSGTSLAAGLLSASGYFMGENLYPPRDSNPKGFFEDPEINGINESLLAHVLPQKTGIDEIPGDGQRWLSQVDLNVIFPQDDSIIKRIQYATQREPFCFKDPRFSYTLPVWRPYLNNTGFICIFRDPATTVKSILKECRDMEYLHSLAIDHEVAQEVWFLIYKHILDIHRHKGDWLFIHYEQLLSEEGLNKFENFTGAKIDRSFPDKALNRLKQDFVVTKRVDNIYRQLCELAGYPHDQIKILQTIIEEKDDCIKNLEALIGEKDAVMKYLADRVINSPIMVQLASSHQDIRGTTSEDSQNDHACKKIPRLSKTEEVPICSNIQQYLLLLEKGWQSVEQQSLSLETLHKVINSVATLDVNVHEKIRQIEAKQNPFYPHLVSYDNEIMEKSLLNQWAPWRHLEVPPYRIPGMITTEEKQYYLYISKFYSGKGQVLELGPWLGCSTAYILHGLTQNRHFGNHKLFVYDDFIWRSSWMDSYYHEGNRPKNHQSFRHLFEKYMRLFHDKLIVQQSKISTYDGNENIQQFSWNHGKVELCFVDCGRNLHVNDAWYQILVHYFITNRTLLILQDWQTHKEVPVQWYNQMKIFTDSKSNELELVHELMNGGVATFLFKGK